MKTQAINVNENAPITRRRSKRLTKDEVSGLTDRHRLQVSFSKAKNDRHKILVWMIDDDDRVSEVTDLFGDKSWDSLEDAQEFWVSFLDRIRLPVHEFASRGKFW